MKKISSGIAGGFLNLLKYFFRTEKLNQKILSGIARENEGVAKIG